MNFNPITRTYFKCSIYSPSNRLFTVDEVTSTFSGDQLLSHSSAAKQTRLLSNHQLLRSQMSKGRDSPSDSKLPYGSFVQASSKSYNLAESPELHSGNSDSDESFVDQYSSCGGDVNSSKSMNSFDRGSQNTKIKARDNGSSGGTISPFEVKAKK